MAITQAMATSFKVEILSAYHNFNTTNAARSANTADAFKIALYTSSATLGAATTAYSGTNEVPNGSGYTTGGNTLTISQVPTSTSTTAWLDFADSSWSTATITANGALIYNSSQGNRAVAVLAFGSDKTSTSGTFTIVFPAANSTDAIIRIA
jgi:hypothetical protein